MPDWLPWLIAAGVFATAETASMALVLAMFAGGAAAGAIVAAFGGPVLVQILVAVVATAALLVGIRPVVMHHLFPAGLETLTGTDALVGQEAVVLDDVGARDGRVRLNGGEWSARRFDGDGVLPAGTVVRVMKITGATALVLPEDPTFLDDSGAGRGELT